MGTESTDAATLIVDGRLTKQKMDTTGYLLSTASIIYRVSHDYEYFFVDFMPLLL